MADVNIDGVVTWLKNWFYDKEEMTTSLNNKVNVNQGSNNANKNVVTGSGGSITVKPIDSSPTQNSTNMVESGGVYTAISGLDGRISTLENFKLVEIVSRQQWKAGTGQGLYYNPSNGVLNKIYIVPKDSSDAHTNDGYDVYILVNNSGTYSWEKVDDFDLNFDDIIEDLQILDRQVTMTNAQGIPMTADNEPFTLYDRMDEISTSLLAKGAKTDDVDWTYSSNGFTNGVKLVSKTDNANGRITLHLKS